MVVVCWSCMAQCSVLGGLLGVLVVCWSCIAQCSLLGGLCMRGDGCLLVMHGSVFTVRRIVHEG